MVTSISGIYLDSSVFQRKSVEVRNCLFCMRICSQGAGSRHESLVFEVGRDFSTSAAFGRLIRVLPLIFVWSVGSSVFFRWLWFARASPREQKNSFYDDVYLRGIPNSSFAFRKGGAGPVEARGTNSGSMAISLGNSPRFSIRSTTV
jgi:hypothetical protein